MKSGIYIIRNMINGRIYVGSSYRLSRRISEHNKRKDWMWQLIYNRRKRNI